MTQLHDLAGAYALDALDGAERDEFERHLRTCADCRTQVAELQEGAARLGLASEVAPPPELRDRVMAEIDQTMAPEVDAAPAERRSWRDRGFAPALAASAALAALVIALGGLLLLGDGTAGPVAEILAAPDAQITMLDGPAGTTARLVYSPSQGQGVLAMSGVSDVGSSETYALWLIDDEGPMAAGLFQPVDGTVGFLVEGDFVSVNAVGITIEPAGGSPQPTGEILFVGTVG